MNIIILCDQEDCIYNMLNPNHPEHAHHDHDTDKCTHLCPITSSFPRKPERMCFSKKINSKHPTSERDFTMTDKVDEQPDSCCGIYEDPKHSETHKCFVEPLPGKPNLKFKKK